MIEHAPDTSKDSLSICPLLPADVPKLRLGWWSRVDNSELARHLESFPGASVWMPATHEFALVAAWRHRESVAHLFDLVAVRHPVELTRAAIEQTAARGARLFIVIELSERRQDSFYERSGLRLLETVISYELVLGGHLSASLERRTIERIEVFSDAVLADLMEIDSNSFPWLWQNSEEEFREYFQQAGVEIYLLRDDLGVTGYLGLTVFPGWGHVDRIAVRRDRQGRGHGRQLTQFAVSRLRSLGAMRIGLTTQLRNVRSQSLYESLGFRRQAASDYRIYGRTLWQNDSVDDLVAGE